MGGGQGRRGMLLSPLTNSVLIILTPGTWGKIHDNLSGKEESTLNRSRKTTSITDGTNVNKVSQLSDDVACHFHRPTMVSRVEPSFFF